MLSRAVSAGLLAAAIQIIRELGIDVDGVAAGELDEMVAQARWALLGARGVSGR